MEMKAEVWVMQPQIKKDLGWQGLEEAGRSNMDPSGDI